MSLFEVYGADNQLKMHTNNKDCIYDAQQLSSLQSTGHYFKLEGKRATKSQVLEFRGSSPRESGFSLLRSQVQESTKKQILCENNGKIYQNQAEAAKDLGIDPAQVSDSIKTGRPRSGYTFKKV